MEAEMRTVIVDPSACRVDIEKGEWQKLINTAQAKLIEIEEQNMTQVIVIQTGNEKISFSGFI